MKMFHPFIFGVDSNKQSIIFATRREIGLKTIYIKFVSVWAVQLMPTFDHNSFAYK
jgi:hypothetical protein